MIVLCTSFKNGKAHHLDPFLRWDHLYQSGGNSSGSKVHGLLIRWSGCNKNGVETLGQLWISGCTCSRCCTAPGAPPWDKSIPGLSQWIIQGLQVLARSNHPMVYSNHLLVVPWLYYIPSRKLTYPLVNEHNYRKSSFLMGKSTIDGHVQYIICLFTRW